MGRASYNLTHDSELLHSSKDKGCTHPHETQKHTETEGRHVTVSVIKLASSLSGRHSPNALTNVVRFFFGSGLASARIIGFLGFEKKRIICMKTRTPRYITQFISS
ncbi:AMP-dependent synthetase and ligase [Striga asiatica]|uniref:AMP-dependent synthetase and ligase n=1 Tax=Striga asiatica TaxID=4170 RepID=A0A5A7R2E7_STRAF|nr:AMP-dependent synthetase and ligase [Striga asiatica]